MWILKNKQTKNKAHRHREQIGGSQRVKEVKGKIIIK